MALDFDSARLSNPYLTSEHEEWRSQVRRFMDREIMPFAAEWDEAGEIPDELWAKAAEVGILGLGYPEELGGVSEGIDLWFINIMTEEIARAGVGGIFPSLLVHGIGLPPVVNFAREAVKQAVAPAVLSGEKRISLGITEPSGGSDVANIQTTARREGDYYIVNGSKTFISGGMRADWTSTAVRTGDEGPAGISMLLIPMDAEGVSRTALDRKQGWWCSDTATIYFDNVKVPVENLLGEEGHGFLVIMNNFNSERMGMCVQMEAFSRVCLEEAVEWAQQRKTFGKRLADLQNTQFELADMAAQLTQQRVFIDQCISWHIEGKLDAVMAEMETTC